MSSIPEVEPVATFPDKEVLDTWGRRNGINAKAFDQWVERHGELLVKALSGDSLTQEDYVSGEETRLRKIDFRASVLRKLPGGSTVRTVLALEGYQPEDMYDHVSGFGDYIVEYYRDYTPDVDRPDELDESQSRNFEQLEILPEGMGIRLRRETTDPYTITHIDTLGNITSVTPNPFIN